MPFDLTDYSRTIDKLLVQQASFVTITLIDIRGSAPQIKGAKAIVTADSIEWGTIGGGKIEAAAVEHAQTLLDDQSRECELIVWNLQTDIGMTCGGEVKLFFEVHSRQSWPIVVYGAGHVAKAVVQLLCSLNCHVTCIDTRNDWLGRIPENPKLTKVCVDSPALTVKTQPSNAFFVLMSKGHATDLPVLAEILKTRTPKYVGVIGSRQKASVLKRELENLGLSMEKIDSFYCPLGLPLGDNTPNEIAISVVAQLIQKRDEMGRD